jgi:hypothetical protein
MPERGIDLRRLRRSRGSPHRGPGEPLGLVRNRAATGGLARHLLTRDERWQKTYYGGDRSNVLRFVERQEHRIEFRSGGNNEFFYQE